MSENLYFYKGLEANLPTTNIKPGALYHCTDTGNTYLGKSETEMTLFSTASGKQNLNGSITIGNNSVAYGENSVAIGSNVKAGCKGFYWYETVADENGIVKGLKLTLEQNGPWWDSSNHDVAVALQKWRSGDEISYKNGTRYVLKSIIDYIATDVDDLMPIVFFTEALPFTVKNTDVDFSDPSEYSIINPRKPDAGIIAFAPGAFVTGINNSAAGRASVALGEDNLAAGEWSYTEGYENIASGTVAHAEGNATLAANLAAHAEGVETIASGARSHAEGYKTQSVGSNSHAEGASTIAIGQHSHAEGGATHAEGLRSHAEGHATFSTGSDSHAEGNYARAEGISSHAEGGYYKGYSDKSNDNPIALDGTSIEGSLAAGDFSHAEGRQTYAKGNSSHTEGFRTLAKSDYAHAEGSNVIASGISSHAEGNNTVASGKYSHAEGDNKTTASGDVSHAEGYGTTAVGKYSHSEGYDTQALGDYSHAENRLSVAYGPESHAEGRGDEPISVLISGYSYAKTYTLQTANNEIKAGQIITYKDKVARITKYDSSTLKISVSDSLCYDNSLTDAEATIYHQGAFGNQSHAEGFKTMAMGLQAHSEGNGSKAYGNYTHAEGSNTKAYGNYSHTEGWDTTVNEHCIAAHVEGKNTIANGEYQHVQGAWNIEDTGTNTKTPNGYGKYAHIVGNGTDKNNRSNAYTLDWNGNAWFAGGISTNNMILVKDKGYGDTLPDTGVEGQIFFLKVEQ